MAKLGLVCGVAALSLMGTGAGSPLGTRGQPMLRHPAPSFRLKDMSGTHPDTVVLAARP